MLDPNSVIPSHHEVRVTMRGVRLSPDSAPVQVSTRSDFVAPDMAPVSTLQLELAKGERDWSDGNAEVSVKMTAEVAMRLRRAEVAKDDVERSTCGDVIRKAPVSQVKRVVSFDRRRNIVPNRSR